MNSFDEERKEFIEGIKKEYEQKTQGNKIIHNHESGFVLTQEDIQKRIERYSKLLERESAKNIDKGEER